MVRTFVVINFGSPRLGHTIKTNGKKIWAANPEIGSVLIFSKRVWD